MAEKKINPIQTVGVMMLITLLGKVLGLVRDQLLLYHYGISQMGEAFSIASLVPRKFLDIIFASAISASFIPIFNRYLEKKGKTEAFLLANRFLSFMMVASVFFMALGIVFSYPIVQWMGAELDFEHMLLSAMLLKIMMPILVFSCIAFSLTGILQSLGEFNIPAAMSLVSNGLIIFYYIAFREKFGLFGLAVFFVLGWATQIVIQFPFLKRNNFRFHFTLQLDDPGLREILALMLPVMVSTWAQPVNVLVNTMMANRVVAGWGLALNSADTLFSIISGVFILSVTNLIFPKLSREVAAEDNAQFAVTMKSTIRAMVYILIPMTVGLFLLSDPLIRLFYQRGQVDREAATLIARAMGFYVVGIMGLGIQTVASRALYALKDGKTPLVTGVLLIALNAGLGFLLLPVLGVGGPALASSVSITFVAILMLVILCRRNKGIVDWQVLKDSVLVVIASLAMGVVVYFTYGIMTVYLPGNLFGQVLTLGLSVLTGVTVYFACTYFMKIQEVETAMKIVKEKRGKE